jgi:deoxyribodipyrimidine photolyase
LYALWHTDDYPEANLRHYTFMLEGLKDVQEALEKRGIKMVVRKGSPERYVEKVERRICASG